MNVKQRRIWYITLAAFALLEFLMLSYLKAYFGIYFSPLVFFIASAGVSVTALVASYYLQVEKVPVYKSYTGIYLCLPLLAGLIFLGYSVFSAHAIDHNQSDVFAQVLSPSTWLLKGEYAYQDVVLPTYTMHNTYLPAQWGPFVLSVAFGFDPRWIPLISWSLAFLVFVHWSTASIRLNKTGQYVLFILTLILSLFSIAGFIIKNPFDYSVTFEMLPVAYYILLVIALLRGSWWGIGLSMGLCLLSRFSVILLTPFLLWYIWQRYGKMIALKSVLASVALILLLFVLPFMTTDPQLPSKIVANYNNGALGEWQVHSWQEAGSEPYQIARGMGAAIFFKKLYEYDLKDGVHHLRQVGFTFSILSGLFLIYLFQRNKEHLNHDWLLLGGLKLYFTFFYTFSLIPYPYLFVLPLTISALILIKAYTDTFGRQVLLS